MSSAINANFYLFTTAIIWGSTFIFLRGAMSNMRPFAYNGIRFALGAGALLIVALPLIKRRLAEAEDKFWCVKNWLTGGFCCGFMLFTANSFQVYGLQWTMAGKAGFITAMYVVIVPLLSIAFGKKVGLGQALGVAFAVVGVYFLSVTEDFALGQGDGWVLIGSFFWAAHVLMVGHFSPKMDSLVLGCGQAAFSSLFGLIGMVICDQIPNSVDVAASWLHIVWGGLLSVGIGFTLQVVGQKKANPVTAAIILQMEAVVAALAGWLVTNETMTVRMVFGAAIMFSGFLICQLWPKGKSEGASR